MEIDIYQHCPCLSGKKIKFCCGKDVVSDMNQILAKNSSGQAQAAMDQLERTIKRVGPKNCLLTIQTHILITNGEIEKARASNELLLKNNPDHPTGLHHQAMIQLAEGRIRAAVSSLQDAMDAIKGDSIPLSLANAFRVIGLGLLQSGHIVGARAHLQFANALKGSQDEELNRMVYETFRVPGTSILLKNEFQLPPLVEDVPWAKKYINANRAIERGQFRKSLQFLKAIDKEFPDQLEIVRGIAILEMFLGNFDEIAPAWRRLSRLTGVPEFESIEAEAMAQHFDPPTESEKLDVVRVTWKVEDADQANEIALSNPRLVGLAALGEDPFQEGPPPRNAFYLLNRDQLQSADDVDLESLPEVVGELMLYGKQTDRSARLEWVSSQGDRFNDELEFLKQSFNAVMDGEPNIQKVAETSALGAIMSWNWHLPDGVTHETHFDLVKQKRDSVLKNNWANFEFSPLDGLTPRQAAETAEYRLPLAALLMNLEQSTDGQFHGDSTVDDLRQELGVEKLPSIDPANLQNQKLSPVQQQYLQFEKLTDQQLLDVQAEAMSIGNVAVLKQSVPEVLSRSTITQVPRDVSYSMLSQLADDTNQSLDYLAQARSEAKKADRPIGIYLVQEFEFRLSRGLTEKLPELLDTIKRNHLKDPDVEFQLVRVLRKFNLMEGGPVDEAAAAPNPEQGATVSPIWTPESDEPAETVADSAAENPSKLWIPD